MIRKVLIVLFLSLVLATNGWTQVYSDEELYALTTDGRWYDEDWVASLSLTKEQEHRAGLLAGHFSCLQPLSTLPAWASKYKDIREIRKRYSGYVVYLNNIHEDADGYFLFEDYGWNYYKWDEYKGDAIQIYYKDQVGERYVARIAYARRSN
jgi:hypothetical protein